MKKTPSILPRPVTALAAASLLTLLCGCTCTNPPPPAPTPAPGGKEIVATSTGPHQNQAQSIHPAGSNGPHQ